MFNKVLNKLRRIRPLNTKRPLFESNVAPIDHLKNSDQLAKTLYLAQLRLNQKLQEGLYFQQQLHGLERTRAFKYYVKFVLIPVKAAQTISRILLRVAAAIAKVAVLRSGVALNATEKLARFLKQFLHVRGGGIGTRIIVANIRKKRSQQYQKWFKANWPSPGDLEAQATETAKLKYRPKISIIVPVYNPPPRFLKEAIESVQAQSYDNWELCLADDASPNGKVRTVIESYAAADDRIRYVFRSKNGHISESSNSALKLAKGDFVALLDHDDILWPNALFEVVKALNRNRKLDFIYSDEDKLSENSKRHEDPFFKPDWSPDYLRSINYITHLAVIRRSLVNKVGGFRKGTEGAQDWDLFLRVTNLTSRIYHIPTILYSWRKSRNSTALRASAKDYAWEIQHKVLEDDLINTGIAAQVRKTEILGFWNIVYAIRDFPLVSIVIPTKDQYRLIKNCLDSIYHLTTYLNFEVILVDTGSTDKRVWNLYDQQTDRLNIKVVKWTKKFNFSAACNYGAAAASGQYFLFLNNDTQVITPNWVEALLMHAQRPEIGAVGAKLLYPNGSIQHAGIVLGMGGMADAPAVAGHLFAGWSNGFGDNLKPLFTDVVRNYSAVTAACLMVSRAKFKAVGGFDETYKIAFNDVDFCLKLRQQGWYNLYNPHVALYHLESVSVGRAGKSGRDLEAFKAEHRRMLKKWGADLLHHDPFYNPNYDIKRAFAEIKTS